MLYIMTQAQLDFMPSAWMIPFKELPWGTGTSVLVGITCGILGCFVVLRRMALIGDALSHAVLPGVVIAFIVTKNTGILGLLLGALLAGLTTAVLINLVSQHSRTKEDSAIGIVFTALFALGLILLSNLPRGTHFDLRCFVWGVPEAVWPQDFYLMAIITILVLLLVIIFYYRLKLISFDPVVAAAMGIPVLLYHYLIMGMISATVVAGLKTTGVILVVAMVITPASAAYHMTNRFGVMLVLAGIFGALSALLGMILAYMINAPSGPCMVLVATMIFTAAMLFSPSHGLIFDRFRRWQLSRHIATEDVIKAIYQSTEEAQPAPVMMANLAQKMQMPVKAVVRITDRLRVKGMAAVSTDVVELTDAGRARAIEMVRAHRLWESYLTQRAGVGAHEVHDHAEVFEHAHEFSEEIEASLGHPNVDPHGEEIPELPDRTTLPDS